MWVPHQPSLLRAYPPGDLCRGQHARLPATSPPWGAHSTPGSPTCPLLPFRVWFGASSSTQEMLHPSGTAYSRGYPDPGSGSLRLQLDCGEPRPGSLSGPYRTKAAKRMMVRSWRKKHSPARRSLEGAAAPSAIPGGGATNPKSGGRLPANPSCGAAGSCPHPGRIEANKGEERGRRLLLAKENGWGGSPPGGVPLPAGPAGRRGVCLLCSPPLGFPLAAAAGTCLLCARSANPKKEEEEKGAEGARLAFGKRLRWLPALPGWDFGDPEPGWGPRTGNDSGLGLWSWWGRWALLLGHCGH